ncbi:hypothetical protein [Gephyromycinifex aptenodytis]|uniref:hypothetical protein n=1 Tax=Gephyromycinifex aptenodytis TaxID=2716227 RepID=UPI0014454124|nr:hypothetical protein [Gephyromycinifex aptenodytis]
MLLSVLAALLASAAMGAAAVAQAVAARRTAGLRVVLHPWYLTGGALDLAGWGLSLLAMQHLPLLAVQTVLAASLALTVVLSSVVLGVRPAPSIWMAVILVCLACAVVVAASLPGPPTHSPAGLPFVAGAGLALAVILAVYGYRHPSTAGCALIAGLAYSGSAVAARALPSLSLGMVFSEPLVALIVGFSLVGTVMFARALETRRDAVNEASAWLWVTEMVVPSIIGIVVLGDQVRPGWAIPALLAVGLAVFATARISRSAALSAATQPVPSP